MQARIARDGEVTIIHLSGRLDVETAEPFRDACLIHLAGKKVVFDFKALSFVGSSGIIPFLEIMQNYAGAHQGMFNFSGVGTEFRRVFAATPLNVVEIFESHEQAIEMLTRPRAAAVNSSAEPAPLLPAVEIESAEVAAVENQTSQVEFGFLSFRRQAEPDSK